MILCFPRYLLFVVNYEVYCDVWSTFQATATQAHTTTRVYKGGYRTTVNTAELEKKINVYLQGNETLGTYTDKRNWDLTPNFVHLFTVEIIYTKLKKRFKTIKTSLQN